MAGGPGYRPGYHPPGYHPPGYRPPGWRPPYYPPPYVRPPSYRWGRYYYAPAWGWYNTAIVAGATLAFVAALPDNGNECQQVNDAGETLYTCNGTLYRPTYYKDEQVYEIVSDNPGGAGAPSAAPASVPDSDSFAELKIETPYLRGDRVRKLQTALQGIGFDVGTVDGVFGKGTDAAVRAFQEWYGLPVTGVVDYDTASAIAAEYAAVLAPPTPAAPPADAAAAPAEGEAMPAAEGAAPAAEGAAPAAEGAAPATEGEAMPKADGGASATGADPSIATEAEEASEPIPGVEPEKMDPSVEPESD